MSSTRFSNLTEDCVQLIFDRISTQHLLLHVRRVSPAWQTHQQLNCRARRSLIILKCTSPFYKQFNCNQPFVDHKIDQNGNSKNIFDPYNQIHISPKRSLKAEFLSDTFPNLHTLILATDCLVAQHLQSFVNMISHYSLITLQLYLDGEIKSGVHKANMNKIFMDLFAKLNSLTQLERFTFFYCQGWSIEPPIEEPNFLTRIKEFYFVCGGSPVVDVMQSWLRKYYLAGQLNQNIRIYLPNIELSRGLRIIDKIERFPLAKLYSYVSYRVFHNRQIEHLKRIVARFSGLNTVTYVLDESDESTNSSLAQLSSILSPLTKLVHCQLNIAVALSPNEHSANQFKSVKALSLLFYTSFFHEIFQKFCQTQLSTIVHIFPNLKSIRIIDEVIYPCVEFENASKKRADEFFDNLRAAYGRESLRTQYSRENANFGLVFYKY